MNDTTTNTKKVGIGVIGAGTISQAHLGAYALRHDVDRVCIADQVPERAASRAAEFGFRESTGSVDELLARDDIDAVSICTWNNSHAEIAIKALEAGKHVLCEKPLSKSVAEAEAVAEAVERTGRHLQVGYVRRFGRNAQVARRFVESGDLGDIYYAKASIIRRVGNPGGWFADIERSGGGPLIDIGVHCIDLAWWVMGRPDIKAITADTFNRLGNRGNVDNIGRYKAADYDPSFNTVEDLATAYLRFDGGAVMMVDVSFSLHAVEDSMSVSIHGDKGGAEIEPTLRLALEKHDTVLKVEPQIDEPSFDFITGFAKEIGYFVDLVKGDVEPVSPVSDGVTMMKILRGVYEAAQTGETIRF